MIRQGLKQNPSLTAASAALTKAEEDLRAVRGAILYPAANANLQAARQRTSGNVNMGDSNTYNLYNASVGVSYTLDIFGGGRRQMESYQAQIDYQRFVYEATYLTLTANIVTTAISEASLRAQIEATREIIETEQKQLDVLSRQLELGAVSRASVLSQETQLAMALAGLPPLEKQLDLTRHALAVLIGQYPGAAKPPRLSLDALQLPRELPVSLPSVLARQRPDVQAAEALLHQACAAVGVATANLYPQITLSAGYGFQAISTDILFNGQSLVWNLGAGLLQPIFRGGELTARRRSAIAAYDQAAALYQQTVLKAFQNVADVLRALEADARTLQAQTQAEASAKAALEVIEKQFELGAVNFPALLIARRDYEKMRIMVIEARARRYSDTAALFQALGGGWWNRESMSNERVKETVGK
jgi:NodT family efflux transporter outer membrane factor (OMF) lipoprotein